MKMSKLEIKQFYVLCLLLLIAFQRTVVAYMTSNIGRKLGKPIREKVNTGRGELDSVYNATELLDKLLQNYDKRLRPGFRGLSSASPQSAWVRLCNSYQMDCYFRQAWSDTRLKFDGPIKTLPVGINVLDRLWKPDTHFLNGRRSYLHTVTSPNKLLRINKDGSILYSMRLTIKASCPMHLQNFPMDTQTCPLYFGSHGYSTNDVIYTWTESEQPPIQTSNDMTLSQFDLIGYPHANSNVTKQNGEEYSMMSVHFTLRRHMGYFLINVYVPCSLLVICSWVGFWINREATSDRIALGVTTVLTMAFLRIDNRRDLPEVSYSTALDYFLGTCFALILASIIQFAGVHYFTKYGSGEIEPESEDEAMETEQEMVPPINTRTIYSILQKRLGSNNGCYSESVIHSKENGDCGTKARRRSHVLADSFCFKLWNCIRGSHQYRDVQRRRNHVTQPSGYINSVSKIDKTARILFPATFVLFNVFYWITYLNTNNGVKIIL